MKNIINKLILTFIFINMSRLSTNEELPPIHEKKIEYAISNLSREDIVCLIEQQKLTTKEVFDGIYFSNIWGCSETVSGGGSTLNATIMLRDKLPGLLKELKITTFIDAPCGDFNWMKKLNLDFVQYIGIDIVESLIKRNQILYGNKNCMFICLDITKDQLPYGEMILCRDCFQHLSYAQIFQALELFKKSGSIYLLATTYRTTNKNKDDYTGGSYPYNLQLPPFNFPQPMTFIEEMSEEYVTSAIIGPKKSLGLWKLEELAIEGGH